MVGSLRYMAPEVAQSFPYNHKSEVYSFAIVAWEMVALRRPYETITPDNFEQRVCLDGERPKINTKKWNPALCELIRRCWLNDFSLRPDFAEIVDVLMTVVAEAKEGGNK